MARASVGKASVSRTSATQFKFFAPNAKKVSLAGSFNKWDTKEFCAKKDAKGNWLVKISLKPGRYEYKFFVDGSWINDPSCTDCVSNSFGSSNSILNIK